MLVLSIPIVLWSPIGRQVLGVPTRRTVQADALGDDLLLDLQRKLVPDLARTEGGVDEEVRAFAREIETTAARAPDTPAAAEIVSEHVRGARMQR